MSIREQIITAAAEKDAALNAKAFVHAARHLMLSHKEGGGINSAWETAKHARALPQIVAALQALPRVLQTKAVAQAGSITDWGDDLAPYATLASAFLASLRNISVFEAALPFMLRVPPHTSIRVVSGGATGATVGEGQVKLISKLTLAAQNLTEKKTVAIIAASDELLRFAASNVFQQELSSAVAAQTDAAFVAALTVGASPISSQGGTSTAVLQDINLAINALSLSSASKVFLATSPDICKSWALKVTSTGEQLFPQLTIHGGQIAGCEVFASEGINAQVIAFDARQVAASDGGITLDTSNETALQMDSSPDSPPSASTNLISLWQSNITALKAERYWSAVPLRSTAVSVITGVNYGSSDSPA
jgi:hypothetical protein